MRAIRISTRGGGNGCEPYRVTLWADGHGKRWWGSRVGSLPDKIDDLVKWLTGRVDDPCAWIGANLPWAAQRMVDKLAGNELPHKWVYGRIGVVRAVNGVFQCGVDIHGGYQDLPGSSKTAKGAINRVRQWCGTVVCVAPGENAGDFYKDLKKSSTPGTWLLQSNKFRAQVQGESAASLCHEYQR